tara:strand:- start:328 stop:504 length:177 start_codon:yes stop_codon:yes gene_type:complete
VRPATKRRVVNAKERARPRSQETLVPHATKPRHAEIAIVAPVHANISDCAFILRAAVD